MTIEKWVEDNIKPNVLAVHRIDELKASGAVKQYDVHCLVTTATGTNITTQPVNEIGGKFYFGSRIVKNFEESKTVIENPKEKLIKGALQEIKKLDPNATYVGIDTSSDLTVVKLKVGGVIKGFSLLDGELIAIDAE